MQGNRTNHRKASLTYLLKRSTPQGMCLIWNGRKTKRGYPLVGSYGYAHRRMYEIIYGNSNLKLDIMHTCDMPSCINPLHLEEGTRSENMVQCSQRGRNTQATVTVEDVKEIRAIYTSQDHYGLQIQLAKQFN